MIRDIIRSVSLALLLAATAINLSGQTFPVEVINYCGPPNEFLNIVVLGDGYKADQQAKFIADTRIAIDGFFATKPFSEFKDSINVFAIKVISNAEGASLDPANLIDNYFGSSYNSYGIERLLVAWRTSNILSVLNANTPFYDKAAVIVNDTKYGGSGGQFPAFSVHSSSVDLLLHEFAHSLSYLADEYWAGSQYAAEKTNMTQDSNPETIRWKEFLNINQVGIYPHAESPTWYRPHQSCMMRYLGYPFCEVCDNKITQDIESYTNSDTLGTPVAYFATGTLSVATGESADFTDLSTNRPKEWAWTFAGGTPSSSSSKNPTVSYTEAGVYDVTLRVTNQQGSNSFTKTAYINVYETTGSESIDYSESIFLYPNPAGEVLKVTTVSDIKPVYYRILDLTGRLLTEGELQSSIDISALPPGICILLIHIDGQTIAMKFIKE